MENARVATEFCKFSPKRFDLLTKTIEKLLLSANHKRLNNVCRMFNAENTQQHVHLKQGVRFFS